jgi:hypothetical protein
VPKLHVQDLKASTNPMIQTLAATNFTGIKPNSDALLNDLRKDMPRGVTLENKEFVDHDGNINFDENNNPIAVIKLNGKKVVPDATLVKVTKSLYSETDPNYLSDDELKAMLDGIFPGKFGEKNYSSLLMAYYTQSIVAYALVPLDMAARESSNQRLGIGEVRSNLGKENFLELKNPGNIYRNPHDGYVYLESTISGYEVYDTSTGRNCTIKGSTWVFVLEKNGFKVVEADIPDERMKQMYLSLVAPKKLEDFPEYSLLSRIRDAFHETYNRNSRNYSRDAAAFLGYKERGNTYLQNYETLELLALPLTVLKNTLKLFTEFFPRVIEKTMEKIVLHSRLTIKNLVLLGFANIIPTAIFGIAWGFRQIASRLTSPVNSFKSAYENGASYHPLVGVLTAGLSAAISLGLMIAIGAAGVAVLSAAGVGVAVSAATWITSNTAAIGSFCTLAAAKATAALGIPLSGTAVTVVAASIFTSTIIAGVMVLREGFKAAVNKLFLRSSRKAFEKKAAEEAASQAADETVLDSSKSNSPRSSAAVISQQLQSQALQNEEEVTPVIHHSTPVPSMSSQGRPPPASPTSSTATTAMPPLTSTPAPAASPVTSSSPTMFQAQKVPQPPKKQDERKRRKSAIF